MELLDVVDENNELTGEKYDKKEIHEKGLWYRAAFIFIVNSENKLLLQKRAKNKSTQPNKWSITAGHVDSGETERQAALRETEEELGIQNLKEEDFVFLGVKKTIRRYENSINNHFKNIFLLRTDMKINEFVLQKSEVSEVKYFTIDELKNICQNKEKYEKEFMKSFFDEWFLEVLEDLELGGK